MDISIHTSRRIRELVANGVITIGAHITRDGTDVWARSVQPHPRLGVQTHNSYTLEEIETLLAKVEVQPFKNAEEVIASSSKLEGSASLSSFGYSSVEDAISHCERRALRNCITAGGLTNLLPIHSLAPGDLDRPVRDLYARACSVAQVLGPKIVSHITSQRDTLAVSGARDLTEWWEGASPQKRLIVLSRSKYFPGNREGRTLIHGYWLDKLEALPCPFQDAETQVGQPEEEISAIEEEGSPSYSSADDLTSKTEGVALQW